MPEDADQPIEIQAERAEYDQDSATVTYLGNVDVQQGTMRVTADEMTVHYEDQKVVRITAHGGPASYRQMLEPPRGEVEADATVIVYHTQEERVDLRGDAYLSQGGNEMTGDLIHYDIVAGRARAQSGEQGPVRVTVQPDGESEEQP
ncbi:MAG: lipopolysaccharide transport periplasmic protein LptA [Pseudomonadota bacterium]